jgi:hypothetical protein
LNGFPAFVAAESAERAGGEPCSAAGVILSEAASSLVIHHPFFSRFAACIAKVVNRYFRNLWPID